MENSYDEEDNELEAMLLEIESDEEGTEESVEKEQNEEQQDAEEVQENKEEESKEEQEKEVDKFEPYKLNVLGEEIEISSREEVQKQIELSAKNKAVYESETEKMLKQAGMSEEDLMLAIEAKSGNKQAIRKLIDSLDISIDDIDEVRAEDYQESFKYEKETELDRAADALMSNESDFKEYKELAEHIPASMMDKIGSSAESISGFQEMLSNGTARKAVAYAKATTSNNKDFERVFVNKMQDFSKESTIPKDNKVENTIEKKTEVREKVKSFDDNFNMTNEDFEKEYGF